MRRKASHHVAPPEEETRVGTKKLVRAARHEIASDASDVERTMRRVRDGVDVRERSRGARRRADALDVVDRAQRIRGVTNRD